MNNTNNKVLIGSTSKYLDEKYILGDTGSNPIILLNILLDSYNYALSQLENGEVRYNSIVQDLSEKIFKLRNSCPNICMYKNRLVYIQKNTAPEIGDNIITLPLSEEYQTIERKEIIKNYFDAENNGISEIVFLDVGDKLDLKIEGNKAIENSPYKPTIKVFDAKYHLEENEDLIIINTPTSVGCSPKILKIDKTNFNTNYQFYDNDKDQFVFQKMVTTVQELPNDTLIYIHIDTSSMSDQDQVDLKNISIAWYKEYQSLHPEFEGYFMINTALPSEIYDDKTKYVVDTKVIYTHIPPSLKFTSITENWLANPTLALSIYLEQQGLANINENIFLERIKDKSLVIMTFVDETAKFYHEEDQKLIVKPDYIRDYTNFTTKIHPKLKFFKGVIYPILDKDLDTKTFLINTLSALEAKSLTQSEVNSYLGTDVLNYYDNSEKEVFYNELAKPTPYAQYPGLRKLGWQGNFTKHSPVSQVINKQDFKKELDKVLTSVEGIETTQISENRIDADVLGTGCLHTKFELKVKDNHTQNPLFSNTHSIGVDFCAECEEIDFCKQAPELITVNHREDHTFSPVDFNLDEKNNRIVINSINIPKGVLWYRTLDLNTFDFPLGIFKENINLLRYESDKNFQSENIINIDYSIGGNSPNLCDPLTLSLKKKKNSNTPAKVTIQSQTFTANTLTQVYNNITLNSTINYTGTGGYTVQWSKIEGYNETVVNATSEDLILNNLLPEKVYTYKIIVTTKEDNFITEAIGTITINLGNQAPTVNAGVDLDITLPENSITLFATENDYENNITNRVWTQVSGPNTASISSVSVLNPTISNLIEGVYEFKIEVTDGNGLKGSDTVIIVVNKCENIPVADAGPDVTYNIATQGGFNYPLDGSGSQHNAQEFTSILWEVIEGPIEDYSSYLVIGQPTVLNSPIRVTSSREAAGNYTIRLTVTNNCGKTHTDTKIITLQ